MTAPGSAALYTPDILALALALADHPLGDDLPFRGEAVSRVCGSRVVLGLVEGEDGRIARLGAQVTACAIGQAAAALFLRAGVGASPAEVAQATDEIANWLKGEGELPCWPGLAILAPARAFPARHGAIGLPWKAAMSALSNAVGAD